MSQPTDPVEPKSSRLKFWGAAIILLMIVLMLFPINLGNRLNKMAHGVQIGTASNGRKIMSQDRMYAANLLEQLGQIYCVFPQNQVIPLLEACWDQATIKNFKSHPEAFYLLLEESRNVSPGANIQTLGDLDPARQSEDAPGLLNNGVVSSDDLHPLDSAPLSRLRLQVGQPFPIELRVIEFQNGRASQLAPRSLSPMAQERVFYAFRDFLTIQSAASLPLNALKMTPPLVDRAIASQFQTFTLQLAPIDAAAKLKDVPEPTDAQLAEQLKQYAGEIKDAATLSNPFGFGYRIPDRVKLQTITVNRADVQKLVQAQKTPYEWEVEARMAYAKGPIQFVTGMQAHANPTTLPTTLPAETSFDAIKDAAVAYTIDRATDAKLAEINIRLRSTMASDFQPWFTAKNTNAKLPTSSFGIDYSAPEYFAKLAADVQQKFKIQPVVGDYTDKPYALPDLNALESFSSASYELPERLSQRLGLTDRTITAPRYALSLAKPLMDARLIEVAGETALDPYEPSDKLLIVRDGKLDAIMYFRLTDAMPDEPAKDMAPIRSILATDWRKAAAQKLAYDEAAKVAQQLAGNGDTEATGLKFQTVAVGPFNSSATVPSNLDLSDNAYSQFGAQISDKLLSSAPTPVAALDVPLAGRVYVARRLSMTATWSDESQLRAARSYVRTLGRQMMSAPKSAVNQYGIGEGDLAASWFNVDQIYERNEWKPAFADGK